jgi:hypothetical protein
MEQSIHALQRHALEEPLASDDAPTEEEIGACAAEHEEGGSRWSRR